MPMLRRWFHSLHRDDDAQGLVEYTLLIGFMALAAIAVLSQVGVNAQGPWTTAQTTLDGATAAPVTVPATPPPTGGRGDNSGRGDNADNGDHGGDH